MASRRTPRVYELIEGLRSNYRFGIVALDSIPLISPKFNAIVIVKPTRKFTEREKLSLDQYLLHGGQIIWAVSTLYAEQDSLQLQQQTIAYDRGLEFEDLFFKYGVRVNPDLVEDMQSAKLAVVVGNSGGKPQTEALPWPYYPLLNGSVNESDQQEPRPGAGGVCQFDRHGKGGWGEEDGPLAEFRECPSGGNAGDHHFRDPQVQE